MIRFFVAPSDISGDMIRLGAEDAAHIRSLRLRPSELFIVCDGEGTDYICRLGERSGSGDSGSGSGITSPQEASSFAGVVERLPSRGEPTVSCVAYIALMKGDRLDYAVQKSVELGAADIVLFRSERCIAAQGDIKKKTARLQRIALETAKQSGRGRVPSVTALDSFDIAVKQAAGAGLPLFFYECEDEVHIKQALAGGFGPMGSSAGVSIMTGPEGGFEPFEADRAKAAGMAAVSLGSRILRCETAPIAALAAVMFYTDNL